jgi:hypothetical protein
VGDTILPETEEVSMLIIPACALAKGKGGGGARGGGKAPGAAGLTGARRNSEKSVL